MERKLQDKLPGGVFLDVPDRTRRTMKAVGGRGNKTTEWRLRAGLVRAGVAGFRMHVESLPGCPDFFFSEALLVVFVDGCFWHGCPDCGHVPKTRSEFWRAKIDRNRERDQRNDAMLGKTGIQVIRFWEHELASDLGACVARVASATSARFA
ncbi:very short patch repair endonuclease [Candidatus Palauibacter irciniicola]|uniref:very short patch repair endonuclease n=1 Tax=Candidatus Palauibacter irciniicola TaxID=3056733 RepID=UPI003B01BBF1